MYFLHFSAINKAYKMLEDETERKKCLEVVEEARQRVEKLVSCTNSEKKFVGQLISRKSSFFHRTKVKTSIR